MYTPQYKNSCYQRCAAIHTLLPLFSSIDYQTSIWLRALVYAHLVKVELGLKNNLLSFYSYFAFHPTHIGGQPGNKMTSDRLGFNVLG